MCQGISGILVGISADYMINTLHYRVGSVRRNMQVAGMLGKAKKCI